MMSSSEVADTILIAGRSHPDRRATLLPPDAKAQILAAV
jgi:hypothetical protein